jgi:hypothetical protein
VVHDNYPGLEVNVTLTGRDMTLLHKALQHYATVTNDLEDLEVMEELSIKFLHGVRPTRNNTD